MRRLYRMTLEMPAIDSTGQSAPTRVILTSSRLQDYFTYFDYFTNPRLFHLCKKSDITLLYLCFSYHGQC
jgi:hypothetical protein